MSHPQIASSRLKALVASAERRTRLSGFKAWRLLP
jgi:hypothetical protein